MSDSQAYEEVTVASDGVTVIKRFEEDEFPVPAIAFEFNSDRDESVTVRMSDTVPDGIEVEDLGFHPEYGSEYWTIEDETISFERDLEAGGSYTTVYGIRATGSDDVKQFLTEPSLESVDPPLPEEEKEETEDAKDVIPETDDDVVKDAIAGDGEIPGLEDEPEDGSDEDEEVATLELNDPNEQAAGGSEADGTGDGETVSVEGSSLTAALAGEIRNKNVSGEDIKLLRRVLDIAAENESSGGSGTTNARITKIQEDIADLRAYTGALEEFLDENGTGDELINEFERKVDAFDDRLESMQSELQSNSSELDSVSNTVETVDAELDTLSEEVADVNGDMQSVKDEMESMSGEVDSVSGEVTSVSSEVDSVTDEMESMSSEVDSVTDEMESVSSEVDSVSGEVDSMAEELDEIDASIDSLESSVEEIEEQVTDGDVAERIDGIEEQINELQEWQEQIKQTFGG